MNTPLELSVCHYQARLTDLDAPVLKYFIDALVPRLGVKDDTLENIRWGHDPIHFFKTEPQELPRTHLYFEDAEDVHNYRHLWIPFPAPTMNALLRLNRNTGSMTKCKALCKWAATVSPIFSGGDPDVEDILRGMKYAKTLSEKHKDSYMVYDSKGKPIWKRGASLLTMADRYYKFALGRKGLPLKYRKYYE